MSWARLRAVVVVPILLGAVVSVASQTPSLQIVNAGPLGAITRLDDADQVRVVFSEPMIALGGVQEAAPPWIHIEPAVPGVFYWSGTRTLIFSPDVSAPLPYATAFTVLVDASATSVVGHALGAPYRFTFSTPTVRLLSAHWYRKNRRFDDPAVIVLQFNQPVRTADVVAHARVTLSPHEWKAPTLSARARAYLGTTDPAGLARFDAKVAAVRRVTSSTGTVAVRPADVWDERGYPRTPGQVVVETTKAPPTDAWLQVTVDGAMPSPDGPLTHATQSTRVQLEPTFFARSPSCETGCSPGWPDVVVTADATLSALARAVTVVDVTDSKVERPVTPTRGGLRWNGPRSQLVLRDAGFDPQPPLHTWRLHVSPDLRADDGQTLGYPWTAFVGTRHAGSFVALDGSVWEAGAGPAVPIYTRNVQAIREQFESVDPSSLMPRLLALSGRVDPPTGGVTRALGVIPEAVQTHLVDLRRLLSPLGTGIVATDVTIARTPTYYSTHGGRTTLDEVVDPAMPTYQRAVLQITNLGITIKESPRSTLIFVTRLDSGAPVAGAHMTVIDRSNEARWRGTTDGDGVALAPALSLRQGSDPWKLAFVVTAEKDGDVAFLPSSWLVGLPRAEIDFDAAPDTTSLAGSLFTDRGVYQPREDVHIKAILREDGVTGLQTLAAGRTVEVSLRDVNNGHEVDRRQVAVNRWSSAEWTWHVPEDAALGKYQVNITRTGVPAGDYGEAVGDFRVAAFRRPDFGVEATLTAEPAILGTPLHGTVKASYLFGAALASEPFSWSYFFQAVRQPPDAVRARFPDDRYAVGYDHDREDLPQIAPQTGTLDPDGRAIVTLPTRAGGDSAYAYTIEADVEGASHQHIAQRSTLVLHPASIYVAMSRPPLFVEAKTGARVGVSAVDLSGKTVTDVVVNVSLVREQWTVDRSTRSGDWVRREIPAGTRSLRTTSGEMPLSIPVPVSGSYILRATAQDAAGRRTRTELTFYALGSGETSWAHEGARIDLVPERTAWKPGESARILIKSPWPQATALLTVEREGVRWHRRFAVHSTQDVVEVPITEEDVPNVFVSVVLVKGRTVTPAGADGIDSGAPAFRLGYAELTIDDGSKRLAVEVSADRETFRPHDPVNVSVVVSGPDRRPVSGEVTLWAVDKGLLSLTGYTTPDIVSAIYEPTTLQVVTGDNRSGLIHRRLRRVPNGGVPGGVLGGVVGNPVESMLIETKATAGDCPVCARAEDPQDTVDGIRRDFRPLAFWLGSTATGADGRATATVTLPDSLTSYRIMAVAGNDASQFGFGERDIRVAKPLTLLPAFPRFLTTGDHATFGAVVTNAGAIDGTVDVLIRSLDPATLRFGETRRSIPLAAGASQNVTFDAVGGVAGEARVRIEAQLGDEHDAFQIPLTVTRPLQPVTTAAYGDTVATATERLALPPGAVPDAGGLTVDLASTALVGLSESARFLDEYPYECAEQKASRALALLLASDAGSSFGLPDVKPADYVSAATAAVREVWSFQCPGGGFALWAGQCSDKESPYLTAYVLHVLKAAQARQIPIDAAATTRALTFLERALDEKPPSDQWWPVWAASQAYAAKVLAEFDRNSAKSIDQLTANVERLPIVAQSYLADAMKAFGETGPRYQGIVRHLTNAIRIEADRAHVEEQDDETLAWLWDTNVRATAVVLDGLIRRQDDSVFVTPLVRWLLAARTNGRWPTTHDNAMALEAFVAYYRAFETDAPNMTAAVTIGGTTIGTAAFEGRSTATQQVHVAMPDLLKHAAAAPLASLAISRTGSGRLFYTARVQAFTAVPADASDRGISVARRYAPFAQGTASPPSTSFAAGDVIQVTVALTVRGEARYLALTDPLPAGFEPVDDWSLTTARALARQATSGDDTNWWSQWRGSYFDHVEKHDDRVVAFATRLGPGRHEFSYLVRATTAGVFDARGASVEAMYAPELTGRSQATTVTVK